MKWNQVKWRGDVVYSYGFGVESEGVRDIDNIRNMR